jgi:spermidine/putrescine transport system permease protein
MILPIYASLERVDPRLMRRPETCTERAHHVAQGDVPALAAGCRRGHAADLSSRQPGDYVNAALLGDPVHTTMVGNVIDSRFLKVVDYPTAAVLSCR